MLAYAIGRSDPVRGESFYHEGSVPTERDITIALKPPYLAGQVVHSGNGESVGNVDVRVTRVRPGEDLWQGYVDVNGFPFPRAPRDTLGAVRTDADGRFLIQLSGLVQGPTDGSLELRAGSREVGWVPQRILECGPTSIVRDLHLELELPGAIEGRVVDQEGAPARKEVVGIWNGDDVVEKAVSSDDGTFRISGLPRGNYVVLPLGREDIRPSMVDVGPSAPPPPPADLLAFTFRVLPNTTIRADIDLGQDSLGRIDARVPDGLEAQWVFYGMLVGGRLSRRAFLGGREGLESWRPGAQLFALSERLVLPGSYLVWLEGAEGKRLSQTTVDVHMGATSEVSLPAPRSCLSVPVVLPQGLKEDQLLLVRVEAFDQNAPNAERSWVEWGGYSVERSADGFRIQGLPALPVTATFYADGFRETKSLPVDLSGRSAGEAQPVTFERGATLDLELVPPNGIPLPEEVKVKVWDVTAMRRVWTLVRKVQQPGSWQIKGLPRGSFELMIQPGAELNEARVDFEVSSPAALSLRVELSHSDS